VHSCMSSQNQTLCLSPAGVPFVDVLTTMLDETIPLTTIEFEEWCASMLRPFCLAVPLEQHGTRCTMPKAPWLPPSDPLLCLCRGNPQVRF